jgi:hypothetical protein
MKSYRKKPVVITAEQFLMTPEDKKNYEYGKSRFGEGNWLIYNVMLNGTTHYFLMIETLEGSMKCSEKDWIIQGIKNEYYPCKPDIFKSTYEEIE